MDLRSRPTLKIVMTIAAGFALAGCAGTGDLDAPDSPVARYDWKPGSDAMTALMTGTLELRDGCLYIVGTGNTADFTVVPVFTRALASWDAESEVLTYAGVDYTLGDEVAAGGGGGTPSDVVDVPAACTLGDEGSVYFVMDESIEP